MFYFGPSCVFRCAEPESPQEKNSQIKCEGAVDGMLGSPFSDCRWNGRDCCEVPTNEMKKYSCTIQLVGNFGSKKVFSKLFLFDCVSFFMLKDWSKSV